MSITQKINKLIIERKVLKKTLAKELGIARNTLDDYINGNTSITVEKLEKLSTVLNVPMNYWFEESTNNVNEQFVNYGKAEKSGNFNNNVLKNHNGDIKISIESKYREIESLKREIKLKDEIIELLKERGKEK